MSQSRIMYVILQTFMRSCMCVTHCTYYVSLLPTCFKKMSRSLKRSQQQDVLSVFVLFAVFQQHVSENVQCTVCPVLGRLRRYRCGALLCTIFFTLKYSENGFHFIFQFLLPVNDNKLWVFVLVDEYLC